MKVILDLPKWAEDKARDHTIMVLIGQELAAFKDPGEKWKIKKIRCVQCGECCLDTPDRHTPFGSDDEDKCNALKKDREKWICTVGPRKPFRCLPDPNPKSYPGCNIRYF